jgi:hypothetical protein
MNAAAMQYEVAGPGSGAEYQGSRERARSAPTPAVTPEAAPIHPGWADSDGREALALLGRTRRRPRAGQLECRTKQCSRARIRTSVQRSKGACPARLDDPGWSSPHFTGTRTLNDLRRTSANPGACGRNRRVDAGPNNQIGTIGGT